MWLVHNRSTEAENFCCVLGFHVTVNSIPQSFLIRSHQQYLNNICITVGLFCMYIKIVLWCPLINKILDFSTCATYKQFLHMKLLQCYYKPSPYCGAHGCVCNCFYCDYCGIQWLHNFPHMNKFLRGVIFVVKLSSTRFPFSKNFIGKNFCLERRIHVNSYAWQLQGMMGSFNLTSCSHWGSVDSGCHLIEVN